MDIPNSNTTKKTTRGRKNSDNLILVVSFKFAVSVNNFQFSDYIIKKNHIYDIPG